jgi:glycerate kinase
MRIIIAPDSFKECLSAEAVALALAKGWRRGDPTTRILTIPMADGGEGTLDALLAATGGKRVRRTVPGPLGDPIEADYGLLQDGTAIIEMAAASGLALVPAPLRNPERATTRGTGELMRHALDQGARKLLVCVGGSATNDGGAGMAQALGYRLLDHAGNELAPGGTALENLARIDGGEKHPGLAGCAVWVACDVDNPLCGPRGASHVYGPQKGATPAMVDRLDAALRHFGEIIEAQLGVNVLNIPGAGAAGGLAAGLMAFAGGTLRSGVELVAETCRLENRVERADLVITGEGRIDAQTAHGKTPVGVARCAKRHGVPVIAVAGMLGDGFEAVYGEGIDAVFPIAPRPCSLAESLQNAEPWLAQTGERIARTLHALCLLPRNVV